MHQSSLLKGTRSVLLVVCISTIYLTSYNVFVEVISRIQIFFFFFFKLLFHEDDDLFRNSVLRSPVAMYGAKVQGAGTLGSLPPVL